MPQWHKTAFKFQRIRCTICFTSPDNQQKKETTPKSRVPAWILEYVVMPLSWQKLQAQKEVSGCSAQLHSVEMRSTGFTKDSRSSRRSQNGWKTARRSVALYLNELLIQKCKFRNQVSRHWPQLGLPQMALWHHVGVTIGITLDKNGSLYDPAGTESWNVQTSLDHLFYVRDSCSTSRNRSRTSNIVQQSSNQIPTIHRRHDKAK